MSSKWEYAVLRQQAQSVLNHDIRFSNFQKWHIRSRSKIVIERVHIQFFQVYLQWGFGLELVGFVDRIGLSIRHCHGEKGKDQTNHSNEWTGSFEWIQAVLTKILLNVLFIWVLSVYLLSINGIDRRVWMSFESSNGTYSCRGPGDIESVSWTRHSLQRDEQWCRWTTKCMGFSWMWSMTFSPWTNRMCPNAKKAHCRSADCWVYALSARTLSPFTKSTGKALRALPAERASPLRVDFVKGDR